MNDREDQNLTLVESIDWVDRINAAFYARFPWPGLPQKLDYLLDADFERVMLNQDLGDWQHRSVPQEPRIWVAGCGSNQALITALRFPNATVIGSDLSTSSLEICETNARELGVSNLQLRQESINYAGYEEQFDYVICTGVIHHNADPKRALEYLAKAIKPSGILELMVYNRHHRILTSVVQRVVRLLEGEAGFVDFDLEFSIAKRLSRNFAVDNLLGNYFKEMESQQDAWFADLFIQPVEYSYTVESLEALAASCGLEYTAPYISIYDKLEKRLSWNMNFDDAVLQNRYDALADSQRWQVTNLLMLEQSPLLWFYLQRQNGARERPDERQICAEFLDTTFTRNSTTQRSFLLGEDNHYRLWPDAVEYPIAPADSFISQILNAVDGKRTMGQILDRLRVGPTFQAINLIRVNLTSTAFPYLRAIETE